MKDKLIKKIALRRLFSLILLGGSAVCLYAEGKFLMLGFVLFVLALYSGFTRRLLK